jgi:hypothetical protein
MSQVTKKLMTYFAFTEQGVGCEAESTFRNKIVFPGTLPTSVFFIIQSNTKWNLAGSPGPTRAGGWWLVTGWDRKLAILAIEGGKIGFPHQYM